MDQTNRYNELIYTRNSFIVCTNAVAKTINRRLTNHEINNLIAFIGDNRTKNWGAYTVPQIQETLVKSYLTTRYSDAGRDTTRKQSDIIDIHELMKQHLSFSGDSTTQTNEDGFIISGTADTLAAGDAPRGEQTTLAVQAPAAAAAQSGAASFNGAVTNVQQIFGKSDFSAVINAFNPAATLKKNYIVFDSRYRNQDTDGRSSMSWNFLSNSASNISGSINSLGDVKNISAIRVYPFRIPYQDIIFNNSYKRLTMLINEFSGQAFIGQENRRFHFILDAEEDDNSIKLSPLSNNNGLFEFAKTISIIDTLTLTFGMPLEPVIFDIDRGTVTITYSNPARFTMTNHVPHSLQTGDQIYFTGFTSNNPTNDYTVINKLNNSHGYNMFAVDNYSFDVNIDLSVVTAPINNLIIGVYFGSKRIIIPLEITFLAPVVTATTSTF